MFWNLFERIINAVKPCRQSQHVSDQPQSWPESQTQQPESSQEQQQSSQQTSTVTQQDEEQSWDS
jgi:DNA-nicking Smr family endonuclease